MHMRQTNALTIDLEEWYHQELIRKYANRSNAIKAPALNLRRGFIKTPTLAILELLNKYNTKATFFVVGEVAVKNPELIKKIYADGHEIACHTFSHRPLGELGPAGLRNELSEFKKALASIIPGVEIKGFRAPTFSLNQSTAWAINILREFKIKYDSSIFPTNLFLYGADEAPLGIYGLGAGNIKIPDEESDLKEFPMTLFKIKGLRFPVSGGFYLRLTPFYLQKGFLKLINHDRPFIIHLHPWECDDSAPKVRMNLLASFISHYNRRSSLVKLKNLLENFNFCRIDKLLGL